MSHKLAVIGVGNMANAIVSGILSSDIISISKIYLFDKITAQYSRAPRSNKCVIAESLEGAVESADYVLLSVKPQNYPEILEQIKSVDGSADKTYISIGAGITSESVSNSLGGACTIRVLPNLPMILGLGVSVICENKNATEESFSFVRSIFDASGSTVIIDEKDMNRIIGVTSSSPAYVFKFIDSVYKGALAQGLSSDGLIDAICDVFIGSAALLKQSKEAPEVLVSRVASKGGTTERAIAKLDEGKISNIIAEAMVACTKRADELGAGK